MQRSTFSLLALFVLLPGLSQAQDNRQSKTRNPPSTSSNSTVISLLQRSHDLNPQFNLGTRIYLLQRQAEAMSLEDVELGADWARELLALAAQTKGNQRSFAENSAMSIMVRLNPDRALLLLHSLSAEQPPTTSTPSLPNTRLIRTVFDVLIARDGVSALPLLEEEAARIAANGPYPYSAIGQAAMQSVSKEWATNRQYAVEVVQQVFERSFERYRGAPRTYMDDLEFGRMLQHVAGGIPHESVQPALRLLVKNLLGTDTSKYQFEAAVYTADGESAKVDNAIDAAILNLGGLINRVDPELAHELESTRTELHTALQYAQDGRQRSGFFGDMPRPGKSPPPDPNAEVAADAMRLANINPDAAVTKAGQLPADDRRADALLQIARDIAGKQPERAERLIAEVENGNEKGIPELQLDVISARAFVAVARDKKDEIHELLQQAFALATPIILDLRKSGDVPFIPGLGQLVQLGMQNDPDSTVTFVQSVPGSWLKANLLLGAASALTMRMRLPLGSQEPQKSEKSNQ